MSGEAVYISSRQNPYVMRVASLSENKGRAREGLFKFGGFKLFSEAVACGIVIERVILREDAAPRLEGEVRRIMPKADICVFSESAFDKVSDEKSPEGIITVAKRIDKITKIATIDNIANLLPPDATVIALESLRDPGNLGTIIRSAAAFGIDTLILSADCADVYNTRTVRGAMGALFSRRILITDDFSALIRKLSEGGRRTLAATLSPDAETLGSAELLRTDCVVIGNEGHGLSDETVRACTNAVIIPMRSGVGVESLNAATAASIFMWELTKNEGRSL
ncbi:MAG: RNA methyltransferase [Clostridia bacterium]|nr:RNA methyltransferase [Clostridia bacterium]